MTALEKLLKYPHSAVFDKAPHGVRAMRVHRLDGPSSWVVADEVLTVSWGGGDLVYQLGDWMLTDLMVDLVAHGFTGFPVIDDSSSLKGTALIEGSGSQADSSGGWLQVHTNLLYPILGAFGREIREADRQVDEALEQMVMPQADLEWLDLWAALFDVTRGIGWTDPELRQFIPEEAFRDRLNPLAIEKAILDQTGNIVRIEEPWEVMFRLNESALSGLDRFYDGALVGYHLIRPVSSEPIDWSPILDIIHRNRSAGVIVLSPESRPGFSVNFDFPGISGIAGMVSTYLHSDFGTFDRANRLNYMILSSEEGIIRNYPASATQLSTFATSGRIRDPESISSGWAYSLASIPLSSDMPLGDINAIFPRYKIDPVDVPMSLSGFAELSNADHKVRFVPVDEIHDQAISHDLLDASSFLVDIGFWAESGGSSKFSLNANLPDQYLIASDHLSVFQPIDASPVGSISWALENSEGNTWVDAGFWIAEPWTITKLPPR